MLIKKNMRRLDFKSGKLRHIIYHNGMCVDLTSLAETLTRILSESGGFR